jgi:hypothetical protein
MRRPDELLVLLCVVVVVVVLVFEVCAKTRLPKHMTKTSARMILSLLLTVMILLLMRAMEISSAARVDERTKTV